MLASIIPVTALPSSAVELIVSSESGLRLAPQPEVKWLHGVQCPAAGSVAVQLTEHHQKIGGFGASMLEAGAQNLNSLPAHKQAELLELIFGNSGARLSAMKATMLGNDFSTATHGKWTTYDDYPEDFELKHFSIVRDLAPNGSLTFIKRALAAGFEGTIQAYLDFPPDWMLEDSNPQKTVRAECYDVLARYMAMYVEAYASHGVRIDFLECFNEPTDSYTALNASQLASFLGRHAGPTFEKRGLWPRTKLTYGGQCARASAAAFVPAVMADVDAAKYMDVIAYHGEHPRATASHRPDGGAASVAADTHTRAHARTQTTEREREHTHTHILRERERERERERDASIMKLGAFGCARNQATIANTRTTGRATTSGSGTT